MTAAAMPAPALTYKAHLDPSPTGREWGSSWTITFGFGKPAAGTYTEVGFGQDLEEQLDQGDLPERVLEEIVRRVAVDLYGTAWAFTYRPEQFAEAIARWGLRRRERVVITAIEVW